MKKVDIEGLQRILERSLEVAEDRGTEVSQRCRALLNIEVLLNARSVFGRSLPPVCNRKYDRITDMAPNFSFRFVRRLIYLLSEENIPRNLSLSQYFIAFPAMVSSKSTGFELANSVIR